MKVNVNWTKVGQVILTAGVFAGKMVLDKIGEKKQNELIVKTAQDTATKVATDVFNNKED